MKFRNTIVIGAISLFLILGSCSKRNQVFMEKGEYIIFGHFYGFCQGEHCIEIFKLTGDQLYEDRNDTYPSSESPYNGDFEAMAQEKYQKVRSLANKVPRELLNNTEHLIGAPDAADGGGIYFEYAMGGKRHYWLIDQMDDNIPEYLRPFKEEINKAIEKISDTPAINNKLPGMDEGD
ncbi:hypothetical protein C900_02627 [Fulvivirga imtechensis AK7]|uniref:Lipoprotein n=1 Tax=Fulvivirga imtechensis AK7 TaxID=1237149 RepID=L8K262_9BACT|nr:hypothetical protein [Fulvivirga imtechensis]ELR73542.1 hypothetical protein C900_02627 [Fulvivirga imtechensis AK7]